jgi:hypothetical protein
MLPIHVVKNAHPESYRLNARSSHAIARLKCVYRVNGVGQMFRADPVLRELAVDPESGEEYVISRNGVKRHASGSSAGFLGNRGGREADAQ